MIQQETVVDVADNTGARTALCIRVLGGARKRYATVGDVIVVAVKKAQPGSDFAVSSKREKKKLIQRGVVVRTRHPVKRPDGSSVRFDGNAVVLINNAGEPIGTRVFGPVARELRQKGFVKILQMAAEVV
ncbi:MAG: 50S ribosomal protein L14 [Planctomycetota bacterium]|nr:50S ribosomal protein L14 [Planctomycetota bacterium]